MKKELLLAALGIVSLTPGCMKTGSEEQPKPDPQPNGEVAAKKVNVDRLLKRVAEQPAPTELKMGAMCYEPICTPERVEYVCPSCGAKTIHALNEEGSIESFHAPVLNVKGYRTYIQTLNKLGLDAKLDESFLCSACRKEGVSGLFLEVKIKDSVVRNALQSVDDLRKLVAFVQGDLVWKGAQDQESPLKPELPRIKQLLGVKE
jgi:hypothetical protein